MAEFEGIQDATVFEANVLLLPRIYPSIFSTGHRPLTLATVYV
jgi:hypothetical protein